VHRILLTARFFKPVSFGYNTRTANGHPYWPAKPVTSSDSVAPTNHHQYLIVALSEFYESTIVGVSASFGFSGYSCDPEEITACLQIKPAEVMIKGEPRTVRGGRTIETFQSSWTIESPSESKDINVHLRQLLSSIPTSQLPFPRKFGPPSFSVSWKGNYLYAGSGPFYESDVLIGIAKLGAMLWHDIYQIDDD